MTAKVVATKKAAPRKRKPAAPADPEARLTVPVALLRPAVLNVNRVPGRLMKKIKRSITEFGLVENLVVRAHPSEPGCFEVLSGNHRLQILQELKVESAPVVVVELDDAHARLLAQTLNRTRGRDDPAAYRELITDLLETMSAKEIATFLPEDPGSVAGSRGVAPNLEVDPVWGVIVNCRDEADQVALLNEMFEEERQCRALL